MQMLDADDSVEDESKTVYWRWWAWSQSYAYVFVVSWWQ